jgi:predicted N-acetyltransferase YhbS
MISIKPLSEVPAPQVESLLDAAFGSDRHTRTAYRLRTGLTATGRLSFAACDGNLLVGSLQCWPLLLTDADGEDWPLALVGPVSVSPVRQRSGIGKMLMKAFVAASVQRPEESFVMIGDPEYYGRFFGFDAAPTQGWAVPGPVERHRLLARIPEGHALPEVGTLRPSVQPAASAPHRATASASG